MPATLFEGDYTIEAAGDYYFHVKDDQGHMAFSKLHADSISLIQDIHNSRDDSTDIIELVLTENGYRLTDFALVGTEVIVNADVDSHYKTESLVLTIDGVVIPLRSTLLIDKAIAFKGDV
jgi:hypothetical protein